MVKQEERYNDNWNSGPGEVSNKHANVATVVVKGLPHDMPDNELEAAIRNILPKELNILSMVVRSSNRSRAATAFIRLDGLSSAEKAIRRLNNIQIRARTIYPSHDDCRRFTTVHQRVIDELHAPHHDYPPRPAIPSRSEPFPSRPPLPKPSNFRSSLSPIDNPELAQIHIAPLPRLMTRLTLEGILYEHFQSRGNIIFRKTLDFSAAFVNIYNYSKVPIPVIMARLNNIIIGEQPVSVSFQKNPRPITSIDELDGRAGLEKLRDLRGLSSTTKKYDKNLPLYLHIAPFPTTMTPREIGEQLETILPIHFNSPIIKFHCVESTTYFMAFIEIMNHSNESAESIMLALSKISFTSSEGNYKLTVAFQKGTKEKRKASVEELPSQLRHWHPGRGRSLSPNRKYSGRTRSLSSSRSSSPDLHRQKSSRDRSRSRSRSHNRNSPRSTRRNSQNDLPSLRDGSPSYSSSTTRRPVERNHRREEASPDPFDTVAPTIDSSSIDYSTIIVSPNDPFSLEQVSRPINIPLSDHANLNPFTRDITTEITLGYLSMKEVESILSSNSVAPFEDTALQLQYEEFLLGQQGGTKYYLDLLEKVQEFSGRSKRFTEVAKVVVDSVGK